MKLKSLFLMCLAALSFVSCSDDNVSPEVFSGAYNGYAIANAKYFTNLVTTNRTVTLSEMSSGKVKAVFSDVVFGTFSGNFEAELDIEEVNNKIYRLSGSGKAILSMGNGSEGEYDCTVIGAITDFNDKMLTLIFTMPTVMNGMKVEFGQGEVPVVEALVRNYSGYATALASDINLVTDHEILSITRDSLNNEAFVVKMNSSKLGNFTATTKTAISENNVFQITGSGTVELNIEGTPDAKQNLDMTGKIDLNDLDKSEISFVIPTVKNGLTVKFYNGTKKD